MIITIRVPDNVIKLQYATQDGNNYEQWETLVFGEIVSVQAERDTGNT